MQPQYKARIAPFINVVFTVTSEWWEQPRNHRGLDIATPTSLGNVPLYSMCNGTVIHNLYDDGYGNYIIIKDDNSGMGFLYAHMHERSSLLPGTKVLIGQQVGLEGTTGTSTGIHLHLEMQDLSNHDWIYGAPKEMYENPAEFMGFPNKEGIWVIYDGTPIPPEPVIPVRKKFPWVLYSRKIRNKN